MRRCIQLARAGMGSVAPNPLVGCVIVKDDIIIGEGFHQRFGENHAEVNALQSVKERDELKGAEMYINLEPCSHFGKTPPCTDQIIKSGIGKVFISGKDPSDKVSGKGVAALKENGIEVEVGILETEELELNKRFRTFHTKNRPYIILKWAQTLDGFIDMERGENDKGQFQISNSESKQLVHLWRSQEQAILIGANTAIIDNPQLNVREVAGKDPLRILIDPHGRVDRNLNLFNDGGETLVFGKGENDGNTEFLDIDSVESKLGFICDELHKREILSVIVEGGKNTLERFIDAGLWDEARIIHGTGHLGKGLKAPDINGFQKEVLEVGDNRLEIIRNKG